MACTHFPASLGKGQTLEEVKDLLLGEIDKVKKGEFDDWMIEAVINDLRISEIRSQENNFSKSIPLVDVFISNMPYRDKLWHLLMSLKRSPNKSS